MKSQFQSTPAHGPSQSASEPQTLGRSLQRLYKAIATFMVHRPQSSTESPITSSKQRYSTKARLYPYLSSGEEQRDWLERLY